MAQYSIFIKGVFMNLILSTTLFLVFFAFLIVIYHLIILSFGTKKINKNKIYRNDLKREVKNNSQVSSVFSNAHALTQPLSNYDDLLLLNYLHNQNINNNHHNDTETKGDVIDDGDFDDFSSVKTIYQENNESDEEWKCSSNTSDQSDGNGTKSGSPCGSDFGSRDDGYVSGGSDNSSNGYTD